MEAIEELTDIREEVILYRLCPRVTRYLGTDANFLFTDLECVDDIHTEMITFHPDFNGTKNP